MKAIEGIFGGIANFFWGTDWLMVALLGLGVYYTFVTGFIQFKCIPLMKRGTFELLKRKQKKTEKKNNGKISSYQALCVAVASCVGSGNIVGVSTAILAGGPGALFWMWVAAFFGMATKFGEIVLGVCYHGRNEKNEIIGGPFYYITHALKWQGAGILVAIFLFIQNAGGTLIQSNTISQVVKEAFHVPPVITGVIIAIVMSAIISGGFKNLVQIAQKLVPFMAIFYITGGLIIICANITELPGLICSIFKGAFSVKAGIGAAAGISMKEAMRYGVARGLYSNEAGEGSATVLHSNAEVDHPVRQGFYGIMEVFIDTIVLCSTTGITVLITGVTEYHTNPATLAATAFGTVFPWLKNVIYISLILFAGTSLMSQWYFGHVSLNYLKKQKLALIYRFLFPIAIVVGSWSTIDLVWTIQDCALALLIIPNIVAMIILGAKVRKLTKEFLNPNNGYIGVRK